MGCDAGSRQHCKRRQAAGDIRSEARFVSATTWQTSTPETTKAATPSPRRTGKLRTFTREGGSDPMEHSQLRKVSAVWALLAISACGAGGDSRQGSGGTGVGTGPATGGIDTLGDAGTDNVKID